MTGELSRRTFVSGVGASVLAGCAGGVAAPIGHDAGAPARADGGAPASDAGANDAGADDAGAPPPLGVPEWYRNAPLNEWVHLPNSDFWNGGESPWIFDNSLFYSSVNPDGRPGPDYHNALYLISDYSGGVLNTVGVRTLDGVFRPGTWLVVLGGGHASYAGNELYGYGPLETDDARWYRICNPSLDCPFAEDWPEARYPGEYPKSTHTYDCAAYVPTTNQLVRCSGAVYWAHSPGGSLNAPNKAVDRYPFDEHGESPDVWIVGPDHPDASWGGNWGKTSYDPEIDAIWYFCYGGRRLGKFDVRTETWSRWTPSYEGIAAGAGYPATASSTMSFIPGRRLLVHPLRHEASAQTHLALFDVSDPEAPVLRSATPPLAGDVMPSTSSSMRYDPIEDRLIGVVDRTGDYHSLYTARVPADPKTGTWSWERTEYPGATVGYEEEQPTVGIYGKFQLLAPPLRGVLWCYNARQPIAFMKLP
jgi:hypothetical protein